MESPTPGAIVWFAVRARTDVLDVSATPNAEQIEQLQQEVIRLKGIVAGLARRGNEELIAEQLDTEDVIVYADGRVHVHEADMIQLHNGELLCAMREAGEHISADGRIITVRSVDGGRSWGDRQLVLEDADTDWRSASLCQLRDGTIISMPGGGSPETRLNFPDPLSGKSTLPVRVSTDDWKTVKTFRASFQVPLARFFYPVRGLIELDDGRLLMTMYGRMHGDRIREDSPVGFELRTPWIKTRVIVVQSKDRGKSWQYLSTVSYNPQLGFEGQNESDLIRLPSGLLAVFMRTGIHGYVDKHGRKNLDQPLLVSWSADNGTNWSDPQRIHVGDRLIAGIYPRALLTKQNVLAVLRCRPDGSVIFSPNGDGGFWSDEHIYYRPGNGPRHAGMQDMALIGPNTMLVVDVVHKGAWRVEGVPITVTKKARKVERPR